MKVIIAGSRTFHDYQLLETKVDNILQNQDDIEIISGTAKGADQLGERYSKQRGYKLTKFPAPWHDTNNKPFGEVKVNKRGKQYWTRAGAQRNQWMADYADALIAFWEDESTGTKDMIQRAEKAGLKVRVIKV